VGPDGRRPRARPPVRRRPRLRLARPLAHEPRPARRRPSARRRGAAGAGGQREVAVDPCADTRRAAALARRHGVGAAAGAAAQGRELDELPVVAAALRRHRAPGVALGVGRRRRRPGALLPVRPRGFGGGLRQRLVRAARPPAAAGARLAGRGARADGRLWLGPDGARCALRQPCAVVGVAVRGLELARVARSAARPRDI
jgi:hypothetical protein